MIIRSYRGLSDANSHAIESRFDIRRKFAFEPREIEIAMKIGEDRALGPQFPKNAQAKRPAPQRGQPKIPPMVVVQNAENPVSLET